MLFQTNNFIPRLSTSKIGNRSEAVLEDNNKQIPAQEKKAVLFLNWCKIKLNEKFQALSSASSYIIRKISMRKSMQVTLSKICRIKVYLFLFLREGTFFDPQNNVEKK